MNKSWMKVYAAAVFEVMWVAGLKHADNGWEWALTVIAIVISFYGLITASAKLPVGTVYAVFTGLGTAGTTVAEMLVFGEPFKPLKLVLIAVLLGGVIGLKLITAEAKESA